MNEWEIDEEHERYYNSNSQNVTISVLLELILETIPGRQMGCDKQV